MVTLNGKNGVVSARNFSLPTYIRQKGSPEVLPRGGDKFVSKIYGLSKSRGKKSSCAK